MFERFVLSIVLAEMLGKTVKKRDSEREGVREMILRLFTDRYR